MINKIKLIVCLITAGVSPGLFAAFPTKPIIIEPDALIFTLVDIDDSTQSYQQLATMRKSAEVKVKWNSDSREDSNSLKVLLDGKVYWRGNAAAHSATFLLKEGGQYLLQLESCNSQGCSRSDKVMLIVADTDGSHMEPLAPMPAGGHRAYQNHSGKVIATSFSESGGDDGFFPVSSIPAHNLTHILYASLALCGGEGVNDRLKATQPERFQALMLSCAGREDYQVTVIDPYAAVQNSERSRAGEVFYGHFGQLMALKNSFPQLTIVPSIGGETLSDPFNHFADPVKRRVFVDSVRTLLKTWKFFDGVDINWQYPVAEHGKPGKPTDGAVLTALTKELRAMMDELSVLSGKQYELSLTISNAQASIARINYGEIQRKLDHLYLINDAFSSVGKTPKLRLQNPLFAEQGVAIDNDVRALLEQGVNSQKIVVGLLSYAREWSEVHGARPERPFETSLSSNSASQLVSYRALAQDYNHSEWIAGYDDRAQIPWLFNPTSATLLSYENARSAVAKGQYVQRMRLGGLFSADISTDNGDLLNAMHEGLGNGDTTSSEDLLPPIADAGQSQTIRGPGEVVLDGSHSHDPKGGSLSYHWQQLSGPPLTLEDSEEPLAHISFGAVDRDTEYSFSLTVTDENQQSSQAKVKIIEQPE